MSLPAIGEVIETANDMRVRVGTVLTFEDECGCFEAKVIKILPEVIRLTVIRHCPQTFNYGS